jgi:ubiquinone biosynthesis protein UbiJ
MPDPIAALTDLVLPALTARFVLLANHVLTAAPVAPERLKPHAGRVLKVDVEGWSGPLPPPPPLALRVTPAGLFEAADEAGAAPDADLRLRLDASRPLDAARRLAGGELPPVQIEGDAAFAADVNWVVGNVRWDIAADLERVFGATLADTVARAGERAMATAKSLAQGAASVMRKS